MSKRRGNPGWCRLAGEQAFAKVKPTRWEEFMAEKRGKREIKAFVKDNYLKRYIPEEVLAAHRISLHPDAALITDGRRCPR